MPKYKIFDIKHLCFCVFSCEKLSWYSIKSFFIQLKNFINAHALTN